MELKNDAFYSIREVTKFIDLSERMLQIHAKKNNFRKIDNRYMFTGRDIKELLAKRNEKTTKRKRIGVEMIRLISDIDNDAYLIEVLTAIKQGDILERLTEQEYDQFISRLKEANQLEKRIVEYKEEIKRMEAYVEDYRQNVEYLKKSLDSQQRQTEILLGSLRERNYIEAKEKKFDT